MRPMRASRKQQQRELMVKTTRLLRAAARRERTGGNGYLRRSSAAARLAGPYDAASSNAAWTSKDRPNAGTERLCRLQIGQELKLRREQK
jgi:hypothetical protein